MKTDQETLAGTKDEKRLLRGHGQRVTATEVVCDCLCSSTSLHPTLQEREQWGTLLQRRRLSGLIKDRQLASCDVRGWLDEAVQLLLELAQDAMDREVA